MAIELSANQSLASLQQTKRPNIVAQIEGLDTLFGTVAIKKIVQIGDPGLEIGDPESNPNAFYIGGFREILDQKKVIDLESTSNNIRQILNQDLGEGSSISNFKLGLIDDGTLINLITPGGEVDDLLGRKILIWYSLDVDSTSFPEDYNVVFRGIVTAIDTDPGKVVLNINHPDNKKKKVIYKLAESELTANINAVATSLDLDNSADFLEPITGPDGAIDSAFQSYVVINEEIIRYNGKSGNTLTGLTRGQFGTVAASHSAGDQVSSRYRLNDQVMDLTLKMFASGFNGPYVENIEVNSFQIISSTNVVSNAVYFKRLDFPEQYGLTVGDYITTTGASNGANNFTLRQVTDIVEVDEGFYAVVGGASLVNEASSSALASFRSQYDTLPDGFGFTNDEIDIAGLTNLSDLFLASFEYDFLLKDDVDGQEFIEKQLFSPVAAYSLPRKARTSAGYHIGPIPGQNIKIFDKTNILNPDNLVLKRSTNRNFYNEIIYRYDEKFLEEGFSRGRITISQTSKNQIKGGAKTLKIESLGLRESLNGTGIADSQSLRRLDRYQFGAESLRIQTTFGDGYPVEIGDIVVFDGTDLNVADIKNQSREFEARLFEVTNKSINLQGTVSLDILDTSFDGSLRRGLISPSSLIASASSTSRFVIKSSFASQFESDEYRKWQDLVGSTVVVRNADGSVSEETVLREVAFNSLRVDPLSFTPLADYILEFANYNATTDTQKLIYASMNDTAFDDGGEQYLML